MQLKDIGKWKVFSIETGRFSLDGGAMMGSVPKILWKKTNPSDSLNRIQLAMRCLLVDDGENVVLIETGIGDKYSKKFKDMFNIKQRNNSLCYNLRLRYRKCNGVYWKHYVYNVSVTSLPFAKTCIKPW